LHPAAASVNDTPPRTQCSRCLLRSRLVGAERARLRGSTTREGI
jgi:hypothetical protein